ncbi:hypothetical protein FRUB_02420 [Fimbriiglobus ruber]|uniref:Uncharacterized protein n=1 Tax=Fimbriiglobus ruber TaxID=1908690 RepID=A0A225E102_9BACT|nr:hypothetical protein FRUB_02420 [Fimbriiglobus ruber]
MSLTLSEVTDAGVQELAALKRLTVLKLSHQGHQSWYR